MAPTEGDTEGEALTLGQPVSVGCEDSVAVVDTDPVGALEVDGTALGLAPAVPLETAVTVQQVEVEAEAVREPTPNRPGPPPAEPEGVPLPLFVCARLPVAPREGVRLNEVETVKVEVTEAVEDTLCDIDAQLDSEGDTDPDAEEVPQKEGVPESERLPVEHAEEVSTAVPLASAVIEGVPVRVATVLRDTVGAAEPLEVRVGASTEGVPPRDGVPSPGVPLEQGEGKMDADAAPLEEWEATGVPVLAAAATVGVATAEPLVVGDTVGVSVLSTVAVGVMVPVPDADAEGVSEELRVGLDERVSRGEAETEPVSDGEDVVVAERLALPEAEGVALLQPDVEGIADCVCVPETEPETEEEGVVEAQPEDEGSRFVGDTLVDAVTGVERLTEGECVSTVELLTVTEGDLLA